MCVARPPPPPFLFQSLLFLEPVSVNANMDQRLSFSAHRASCTRHPQIRSRAQDGKVSQKCPRSDPHICAVASSNLSKNLRTDDVSALRAFLRDCEPAVICASVRSFTSTNPPTVVVFSHHTRTIRAECTFRGPSARLFEYDDCSLLAVQAL